MDREEKYLKSPRLIDFQNLVADGSSAVVDELWGAPKALLIALAKLTAKKPLVILSDDSKLFDDLAYFTKDKPLEFPSWETLPGEDVAPSPDIVGERIQLLKEVQSLKAPIILTNLQAVLQKVVPKDKLQVMHLKVKMKFPFEELAHRLSGMGYHRHGVAADKGEFALRGGILDVYPVSSLEPYRIEFWDNVVVSIRKYDPISQTSIGKQDEVLITQAEELELLAKEKELATFFDYLKSDPLIIFDNFAEIEDKYVTFKPASTRSFMSLAEFFDKIGTYQKLFFSHESLQTLSEIKMLKSGVAPLPSRISFEAFGQEHEALRYHHPFFNLLAMFCPPEKSPEDFSSQDFLDSIKRYSQEQEIGIHFICQSEAEENRIREMGIKATFEQGYLSSGFYLNSPSHALIPTAELTHRLRVRRQKQRSHFHGTAFEGMSLTPGEAIVHMNSGIGKFLGIEKRPNHLGVETEYMLVEYAEGARLYVPMEQANLVSKYIGADHSPPELHSLGSIKWKRARERTEEAILGYAKDLLQLQAERVLKGGFAYPQDGELVRQFAEEFPYSETPDQMAAILKVAEDMQSNRSMDRLVCGDVGYGKTEVAMRAAFKAVVDGGKQVAVLVPTTVLAMQHFETFSERMTNFPVNVSVLSRFCKPKEIQKTLKGVEEGLVDILIGTLRIISEDVQFKNLGLVIIDEEQRFGVRAKEHLKKIRKEVDCLTLSATPIPRTLYLSLTGARDLSVINTPPEDRLPIQSVVCQSNDELIKNALLRELARGGQAYVIHNRVESIFQMGERIRALVPAAKVVVGHGQMSSSELDAVFHAFKSGKADILIATAIIENGIDIPNANTIIIDKADRFGLADLYQMRGRVGRWNKKAYCYFMVSNTRDLSEITRKRLAALTTSSGHGGGMKIAMHDLQLRGAGNILGTEQSGHVATIGFHLYCKLLKKTVAALQKNEKPQFFQDVKLEFPFDARLPENYINETSLRLEIYQRLGDAENETDLDKLLEEVQDRFGPPPDAVKWLHCVSRIRLFAQKNRFTLIKLTQVVLTAEQSHGKKEKISKKVLIKFPQNPEELEKTVLKALRENFPTR